MKTWEWLLVVLMVFLVGLGIGAGLGFWSGHSLWPNCDAWQTALDEARQENVVLTAEVEEEYYRGMYDTWRWMSRVSNTPVDALEITRKARAKDWYGQPSSGWQWPLATE